METNLTQNAQSLMDRRLLSDQAYDVLLSRILQGQMAPGQRIFVDTIADELEVSRTPVREAVMRLSWMRHVVVERNSRTTVAERPENDMQQRLAVVGQLAELMVNDSAVSLAELAEAFDGDDDIDTYLSGVACLIREAPNRAAANVAADYVAELQLYLTVVESGETLPHSRPGRDDWDPFIAFRSACATDDRTAAIAALHEWSRSLIAQFGPAES
ncbi:MULTISPECIES: GntR family transcriptional regulator [Curtobacterium]|uniref:GntR family transcriptional regulator n=1 Tax=Curtobacterium TaxID=2034 RepID=UPI000F4A9BE6|nr:MULTISPECIES: GntR family transcriptional regulator [Curtobacterium]MBF4603158.1 GntR family transcriptional regulator [Curtobacterium sp. VKM Ac-2884]ROR36434.1 regulatory GntR family protein [Curtobacterium sp. JUb34]UXN20894.1 GntR family transcriptional regulator [Curtobacterium flaccumfaciens pv. flaccumfaciens]